MQKSSLNFTAIVCLPQPGYSIRMNAIACHSRLHITIIFFFSLLRTELRKIHTRSPKKRWREGKNNILSTLDRSISDRHLSCTQHAKYESAPNSHIVSLKRFGRMKCDGSRIVINELNLTFMSCVRGHSNARTRSENETKELIINVISTLWCSRTFLFFAITSCLNLHCLTFLLVKFWSFELKWEKQF